MGTVRLLLKTMRRTKAIILCRGTADSASEEWCGRTSGVHHTKGTSRAGQPIEGQEVGVVVTVEILGVILGLERGIAVIARPAPREVAEEGVAIAGPRVVPRIVASMNPEA